MPEISVIIPHLNQPEFLARCLASLAAQTGDVPSVEIFVVDNGSQELPTEVTDQFKAVTLLSEPEPGPGPARNCGVAASSADILAFIDADCLADPGWLARIKGYFAANADHSILGGDVYIAREIPDQATMLEAYESVYAYRMKEYIARQGFTGTGNLAVRRATMDKVGQFAGLGVAEDRDWGQRATAQGIATHYVPGMIVYHPARKTFAELCDKWDRHTAHDFERMGSGIAGRIKWIARTIAVAGSPLPEIWRILRSKRVSGLGERLQAFLMLIRIRLYRARRMVGLAVSGDTGSMSTSWNRK